MVVDDHPINRLLARQILQKHWKNSAVVEVDNGAKALIELKANHFDLVLMDMVMPEMDGIEATQRLRQELQGDAANIPVLGLTANVNPNDLERFAKAGVDDTLLKPFDQFKLCEQVQHLLNKKIFPGFMMLCGSSARLMVRIMSTAPSPASVIKKSILCKPIPCSPVQVPSKLRARCTNLWFKVSAVSRSAALLGSIK